MLYYLCARCVSPVQSSRKCWKWDVVLVRLSASVRTRKSLRNQVSRALPPQSRPGEGEKDRKSWSAPRNGSQAYRILKKQRPCEQFRKGELSGSEECFATSRPVRAEKPNMEKREYENIEKCRSKQRKGFLALEKQAWAWVPDTIKKVQVISSKQRLI